MSARLRVPYSTEQKTQTGRQRGGRGETSEFKFPVPGRDLPGTKEGKEEDGELSLSMLFVHGRRRIKRRQSLGAMKEGYVCGRVFVFCK